MVVIKRPKVVIKNKDYNEVNKENILKVVHPNEIYKFYLGHDFEYGVNFTSPMRPPSNPDTNPSFVIYENEWGQIKFCDRGINLFGDVFDFVEKLPRFKGKLNGLWQTCCHINYDMHLGLGNDTKGDIPEKPMEKIQTKERSLLQIKAQKFTKSDLAYWAQFGILESTLKKFKVISTAKVYKNGYEIKAWTYTKTNPIYTYYFDVGVMKMYRPQEKDRDKKWMQTYSSKEVLQGLEQLPKSGELLIITKSLKDVMCLYEMGFDSIAPMSEGTIITNKSIQALQSWFKEVIVLYDNDEAGIGAARVLNRLYGLSHITMDSAKDISDVAKKIGLSDAKLELVNKINQHEISKKDSDSQLTLELGL